jgi:hypothetical protein
MTPKPLNVSIKFPRPKTFISHPSFCQSFSGKWTFRTFRTWPRIKFSHHPSSEYPLETCRVSRLMSGFGSRDVSHVEWHVVSRHMLCYTLGHALSHASCNMLCHMLCHMLCRVSCRVSCPSISVTKISTTLRHISLYTLLMAKTVASHSELVSGRLSTIKGSQCPWKGHLFMFLNFHFIQMFVC